MLFLLASQHISQSRHSLTSLTRKTLRCFPSRCSHTSPRPQIFSVSVSTGRETGRVDQLFGRCPRCEVKDKEKSTEHIKYQNDTFVISRQINCPQKEQQYSLQYSREGCMCVSCYAMPTLRWTVLRAKTPARLRGRSAAQPAAVVQIGSQADRQPGR